LVTQTIFTQTYVVDSATELYRLLLGQAKSSFQITCAIFKLNPSRTRTNYPPEAQ